MQVRTFLNDVEKFSSYVYYDIINADKIHKQQQHE